MLIVITAIARMISRTWFSEYPNARNSFSSTSDGRPRASLVTREAHANPRGEPGRAPYIREARRGHFRYLPCRAETVVNRPRFDAAPVWGAGSDKDVEPDRSK